MLFKASLASAAALSPRETVTLGIEVADVDATAALFAAEVADVQGRTVQSQVTHERSGRVTGKLTYDVPLSAASGLVGEIQGGRHRARPRIDAPAAGRRGQAGRWPAST